MSGSMRSSKSRTGLPSHTFEKGNSDDQVILFPILSLSPPLIPIPIPIHYFFYIACSSPLVSTELASGEILFFTFQTQESCVWFCPFSFVLKLKSPLAFILEGFIFLLIFYFYCYHSCFGSYFSFCF